MHVEVIVVTVQFIIKSEKYNDMIQAIYGIPRQNQDNNQIYQKI